FIHFWVSCCICSGDKDRYASAGLARNKYIKFAIAFSSLITPRAGHLPGRDVEPVPNIDIGDRNNQRCKRGLVVVPSGFIPNLVRQGIGAIAEARQGLRERQRGAFSVAEVWSIAPGGHCEEALIRLAVFLELPGMHVHTYAAAIDLARAQFDKAQRPRGNAALFRRLLQTMQSVHGLRNHQRYVFHTGLHKKTFLSLSCRAGIFGLYLHDEWESPNRTSGKFLVQGHPAAHSL